VNEEKVVEGCTFEPNIKDRKSHFLVDKGKKPPIVSKRPLRAPKTGKYGLAEQKTSS